MLGRRIDGDRARRGASATVVLGLVAALLAVLQVAYGPPGQAAGPLICNTSSIFNLDINGNLYALDVASTGTPARHVNTLLGSFATGGTQVNGLGVTPGAPVTGQVVAWAAAQDGTAVFRFDGTTTTRFPVTAPSGTGNTVVVMGAVDPANGIFYYAVYQSIGSVRTIRIFGFDTNANTSLGEVARVDSESPANTTAGDFGFDHSGNLFILVGGASTTVRSKIVRIDAADLVPSTTPPPTLTPTLIADFNTPANGFWNGIAFGANSNLYAQSTASTSDVYLATISPTQPGTVTRGTQQSFPSGFPTGNPNDLASCSTPGTLAVGKDLTRAAAGDQFTLRIARATETLATATTSGSTTGPQDEVAGPIPAVPATTYTISEQLSQATDTSIDAYSPPSLACLNTATDPAAPVTPTPAGPRTFTLAFPGPNGVAGATVVCTFTNAPAPPRLTLRKELAGSGRLAADDQFTMRIDGGTPAGSTGDPTTQGTGAAVTSGTGTLTLAPAAAGTTYDLSEVMAPGSASSLDDYQQSIRCEDLNGVQTGLPDQSLTASTDTIAVVPAAGADIDCVLTNAPKVPLLGLTKALATDRVRDTDQFRVAIRTGGVTGPELGPEPGHDPTTAGTGATVEPETGTTGFAEVTPGRAYYLTETAAGTPSTDLGLYTPAVTCEDLNGVQPAGSLPQNAPLTPAPAVRPVAGSWISCTITNTAHAPSLALTKAFAGPRIRPGDQFTVRILRIPAPDGPATVVRSGTTAGTGATVTPGSGTTGVVGLPRGDTVFVDHVPAAGSPVAEWQYTASLTCTDANAVQPDLPHGRPVEGAGPVELLPVLGARISCTITNTPLLRPPPPPTGTPSTPHLRTVTSHRRVAPGHAFRDRIHVRGLAPGHVATAVARLYGPFATRAAATCRPGDLARSGTLPVHNGVNRTGAVRVRAPGVYTWQVTLHADASTRSGTHRCGQAAETTLVAKPGFAAPIINGGFAGTLDTSTRDRRAPTRIRMPAIGMDTTVQAEGVRHGRMGLPGDVGEVGEVGWLRKSAGVGDLIGTAVVGGHVSDRHDRPGALFRLEAAHAGQPIRVVKGAKTYRFKVVRKATFPRGHRLPQRYFRTTGRHRLALISCTAKVVYPNGHFHYTRYVVVIAKQVRR